MEFPLPYELSALRKKTNKQSKMNNYKISYLFSVVPEYNP